jgi:hypothetical protein
MLWVAITATFVVAVALLVMFAGRSRNDLGSVSARWMSQHRADTA